MGRGNTAKRKKERKKKRGKTEQEMMKREDDTGYEKGKCFKVSKWQGVDRKRESKRQ